MIRTLAVGIAITMTATAAVKVEKTAYAGWPNCYRITNGEVELIVTTDVGPRVIRYGFVGGQNLFKEFTAQLGNSGEKEWQIRGGHRLWVGPEDLTRTYALDNAPVQFEELPQKEAGVLGVRNWRILSGIVAGNCAWGDRNSGVFQARFRFAQPRGE